MIEVIMPKMGDGMEEGTLVEWTKNDGDAVKSGEVIGNIQTDKATLELESPGTGRLTGLLIGPGETVPVGKAIAVILKEGETLPPDWSITAGRADVQAEEKPSVEAIDHVVPAKAERTSRRTKASPLAKRLAEEAGIAVEAITGTGPDGRIVADDVRGAVDKGPKVSSFVPVAPAGDDKRVPLNNLRRIIAQRTAESKATVPHYYVTLEVDLEKIAALREFFKEEDSGKISVNDFVVKATSMALVEMPQVNATFMGDHILQFGRVNIGIAAAVDDGLLMPVIKDVQAMTLRQIADASKSLVGKARDGKLHPDEMSDSTFAISNMGMLNVDSFSAIINQPNAGIIAISSASKRVVPVNDEEAEIRLMMNITGSFDHRVVDGSVGAKFMNVVRDYLQNPTRLLN